MYRLLSSNLPARRPALLTSRGLWGIINPVMERKNIQERLDRVRAELAIFYEIGNAMRSTLNLEEILFIILTGVTSHAGLGFNRAMLFLVNEQEHALEGKMGLGPHSGEEAGRQQVIVCTCAVLQPN